MARLGPRFSRPRSPEKVYVYVPLLRSFPGNEAHKLFSGGPKSGVLGGGQKVYVEKVYVLFLSLIYFWCGVHLRKENCAFTKATSIPARRQRENAGPRLLDLFFDAAPQSRIIVQFFELSTKAAFDTLRLLENFIVWYANGINSVRIRLVRQPLGFF